MKNVGIAKKIFGMEILKDMKAGKLYLNQKWQIEKELQKFNMLNTEAVSIPLSVHFKLSSGLCPQLDDDIDYMSRVLYSSTVGSLMYAMVCTRPDLAQAVSAVGGYIANLENEHWKAMQ